MRGAEYIAAFLHQRGCDKVFAMTGGAAAFMLDAVSRHPGLAYHCVQHEQAAAMAADAIWRVARKPGVTMVTSGPGATNLLTGIACSYFDSIPTVHITGQVNLREAEAYNGARPRQTGFQETDIVAMARPITKYAVQVRDAEELRRELPKAWDLAVTGRMGPVLIDVPMNVQQLEVGDLAPVSPPAWVATDPAPIAAAIAALFASARRPLALVGAGVGLAGVAEPVSGWLRRGGLPFVASWGGLCDIAHDEPGYCGGIGVYGNRGANYILQNCDALLVLGSRLDNRQRTGTPSGFAPGARLLVVDIDAEELRKYHNDGYGTLRSDLAALPAALDIVPPPRVEPAWRDYVADMKTRFFRRDISTFSRREGTLSPYGAVERLNQAIAEDAIVIGDTGATVCWLFQHFHRTRQTLFTAGGNSPMGYALPAAIGAALECPDRQVVAVLGDGGFQLNIQELATIAHLKLNIAIVVMNNMGYGIIRQFQDSYLGSRHVASTEGYCQPDFGAVATAYGLGFHRVERPEDLRDDMLRPNGPVVVELCLHPNTLIEPKLEMGRPINDQFPYVSDAEFAANNRFVAFQRRQPAGG